MRLMLSLCHCEEPASDEAISRIVSFLPQGKKLTIFFCHSRESGNPDCFAAARNDD